MARVNAQELIERFKRRASAAAGDYRQGVNRVSESPGQKAASRQDQMLAGVTQAVTSGRWAQSVASVPLEEWKRQTSEKGGSNYATGVQQLSPRAIGAMQSNLDLVNRVESQVNAMPDATFEDRVSKSVAFQTAMHEAKQGGRR